MTEEVISMLLFQTLEGIKENLKEMKRENFMKFLRGFEDEASPIDYHEGMSIHPYLFQKSSVQRKETALHREDRDKSVHSYMQSTLDFDVSQDGGIPHQRPPNLDWVRDILTLGSPFLVSKEVMILEDEFGMGMSKEWTKTCGELHIPDHQRSLLGGLIRSGGLNFWYSNPRILVHA